MARCPRQMQRVRWRKVATRLPCVCLFVTILCSCGAYSGRTASPRLTALQLPQQSIALDRVAQLAPSPDLLAVDAEMAAFVLRYTSGLNSQRQRLVQLHRALKSPAILGLQYDAHAEGSATESFHRETVNCLSYANLMVAMAREAGIDARYQMVDVRPQWSQMGERLAVRLHVNVIVKLRGGDEYMADIDPLGPTDIIDSRVISDTEALALHHSNVAMTQLAEENIPLAWANAVRAVQVSPAMAHLWVNLGAVYRVAGQHTEAELSYLHALKLDSRDRSAMNNLVVLYALQGREDERRYWQNQVEYYQRSNPYYHAWLADLAGENGDWDAAVGHYQRALSLDPKDSTLLYRAGRMHYDKGDFANATRLLDEAISNARLRSQIERYRELRDRAKREQLALL